MFVVLLLVCVSLLCFAVWCHLQLQKKFRLDLDDGEAAVYLQSMINESVKALLPQMVESFHRYDHQPQ